MTNKTYDANWKNDTMVKFSEIMKHDVMAMVLLLTWCLSGCSSRPRHEPIWLNALATKHAEENKEPWVIYNTNYLRIYVNPLWDAEIGLKDDGTAIWRKIQPLK